MSKHEAGEDRGSEVARLPRGRHGLPRELVIENQRERLINGVIEAVAEHGYGATTIAQITTAAKLSRRTFYEHFSNKEDCFSAAYELSINYINETMLKAASSEEEWAARVRSGLADLLETLATNPAMTAFILIAPVSAGDQIADRHHRAMRALLAALIAGPPGPPGSVESSETREQALAGGLSRLIVRKVNEGESEKLAELLPDLLELLLQPYIGAEEAVRVAHEGR